ncbi:hypothetical protein HK105_206410 [Polyrhizophydium stewartii]|uniref:DUF952 domain-containing protein n=1 Tax=Polyrhizophydium stewartii TaxID=2732419 RepID=A0ABR4N3R9_9FUNG
MASCYKILTPAEFEALRHLLPGPEQTAHEPRWPGTAFDQGDGFVHLSTAFQTLGTANNFFGSAEHLVVLEVDGSRVEVRWELIPDAAADARVRRTHVAAGVAYSGFPHVYGGLDLDAVVSVVHVRKPAGQATWDSVWPIGVLVNPPFVYKMLSTAQFDEIRHRVPGEPGYVPGASGERWLGTPLDVKDGFIHQSDGGLVLASANRFFKHETEIVVLVFEYSRIADVVEWESPEDRDKHVWAREAHKGPGPYRGFPHVFGGLDLECVARVVRASKPAEVKTWDDVLPALLGI